MTKEELKQEAEELIQRVEMANSMNCFMQLTPDRKQIGEMLVMIAEPREKRIEQLEKENIELKKQLALSEHDREHNDYELVEVYKNVSDLEKENTELKKEWQEQVQKATDEGYARTLQTMQLTKAKVFIRSLKSLIEDVCDINYLSKYNTRLLVEAEQFLSEVEK